jgi:hypothetical protein
VYSNPEFCLGSLLTTAYIPAILLDNGVQVTVTDPASPKITTKSSEKEIIIMGRGYTGATAVFLAIGGKVFWPTMGLFTDWNLRFSLRL